MKFLNNALFFGAGAFIGAQVSSRVALHLRPRPMPHQFAAALDHPWRMRYRDPGETLGLYGFAPGMVVLDVGCGSGTFTGEMASMVGTDGIIHGVDIQSPLLEIARRRIQDAGLTDRVHFHHCGAYRIPLPDDSIDLAVAIAVLPQIPDRLRALEELRRVIKSGGRLAVSEEMPDPAYVLPGTMRDWLDSAGFQIKGQSGDLFCYSVICVNVK